jgi:hypothetical protein
MNILSYFLTFAFGGIGMLALARSIERLVTGEGISSVQFGIGLVFVCLAWQCLKRARYKATA